MHSTRASHLISIVNVAVFVVAPSHQSSKKKDRANYNEWVYMRDRSCSSKTKKQNDNMRERGGATSG